MQSVWPHSRISGQHSQCWINVIYTCAICFIISFNTNRHESWSYDSIKTNDETLSVHKSGRLFLCLHLKIIYCIIWAQVLLEPPNSRELVDGYASNGIQEEEVYTSILLNTQWKANIYHKKTDWDHEPFHLHPAHPNSHPPSIFHQSYCTLSLLHFLSFLKERGLFLF